MSPVEQNAEIKLKAELPGQ